VDALDVNAPKLERRTSDGTGYTCYFENNPDDGQNF